MVRVWSSLLTSPRPADLPSPNVMSLLRELADQELVLTAIT